MPSALRSALVCVLQNRKLGTNTPLFGRNLNVYLCKVLCVMRDGKFAIVVSDLI